MEPYIVGFTSAAHIASRHLIFCSEDDEFTIVSYDEDFTYNKDEDILNYSIDHDENDENDENDLWNDDYKINYFYDQDKMMTVIQLIDKKGKVVDSIKDVNERYQLGDAGTYKYVLSNGDILFVNTGDCESSVLFTTHNLKCKIYNFKYPTQKKSKQCTFKMCKRYEQCKDTCQFSYTEIHTYDCFSYWVGTFLEQYMNLLNADIISNDQIVYTLHKLYKHNYTKLKKTELTKLKLNLTED